MNRLKRNCLLLIQLAASGILVAVAWNILLQAHIRVALQTLELPGKVQMPLSYTAAATLLSLLAGTGLGLLWGRFSPQIPAKDIPPASMRIRRVLICLMLSLPLLLLFCWPFLPDMGTGVLIVGGFLWWACLTALCLTGEPEHSQAGTAKRQKWFAVILALCWLGGLVGIFVNAYPAAMVLYQILDMNWIMSLLPQEPGPRGLEAYLTYFPQAIHFALLFLGALLCGCCWKRYRSHKSV